MFHSPPKGVAGSAKSPPTDKLQRTYPKDKPSVVEGARIRVPLRLSFESRESKARCSVSEETVTENNPSTALTTTNDSSEMTTNIATSDVITEHPAPPEQQEAKYKNRLAEAKACVLKAKLQMNNSKNLKSEIKSEVIKAVDRLYSLVKEAEESKLCEEPGNRKKTEETLIGIIETHNKLLNDNKRDMEKITKMIELQRNEQTAFAITKENPETAKDLRLLTQEIKQLKETVSTLPQSAATAVGEKWMRLGEHKAPGPLSYAAVAAARPPPKHTIIISSEEKKDTSDDVLNKVRGIVDARNTGIQVSGVRKARNQKILISCQNREDLERISKNLKGSKKGLSVEEAKSKDPLVIIRDVLSYNTDEDILKSLKSQNAKVTCDIPECEYRAVVKYRRRARNPLESHVVLQVSPRLWQNLINVGEVHIDLQRRTVADQSPLIQCTRCLGFGHGRKLCKETVDICSHCTGPHHKIDCPSLSAGETPVCKNCHAAKIECNNHGAFDTECPIRKKWDILARSSVSYC